MQSESLSPGTPDPFPGGAAPFMRPRPDAAMDRLPSMYAFCGERGLGRRELRAPGRATAQQAPQAAQAGIIMITQAGIESS